MRFGMSTARIDATGLEQALRAIIAELTSICGSITTSLRQYLDAIIARLGHYLNLPALSAGFRQLSCHVAPRLEKYLAAIARFVHTLAPSNATLQCLARTLASLGRDLCIKASDFLKHPMLAYISFRSSLFVLPLLGFFATPLVAWPVLIALRIVLFGVFGVVGGK